MKKTDIDRLYLLNGVAKNIYLFVSTDEKVQAENYLSYTYHIKYRFMELMESKGAGISPHTVKKAVKKLVLKGYLRRGDRRGDYHLNYSKNG